MASKRTIKLKKYLDVIIEKTATAAITPGMVIELTSTDGKVQAHSTQQGDVVPKMVALEDELQGNGINDAYAADDKVQCWIMQPGEIFYGILADGENVSIGDKLASKGDGMLQKHVPETESWESNETGSVTVYPNAIIGVALEAVNLAGSSGAESSGALGYDKRIKVLVV